MARPPPWGCALAALLLCLVHSSAGQPAWVQRRPPLPWRRSAVQLPQPTVPLLEPPALPAEVPQPVKEPVQPAPEPAQPAPEAVPPVPVTEPAAVPPAVGAGNPPPACSLLDVLWPAPNTTFFIQALEATQLTG